MTMFPERTPLGKVVVFEKATGQAVERWPVDVRGMLATGAYTTDQASASSAVSVDARSGLPVAEVNAAGNEQEPDADAIVAQTEAPAGIDVPDPIATTRTRKGKR